MHVVVMDSLEEYLSGTLQPAKRRTIEAHLKECLACREEVQVMQDISQMMVSLRSEEMVEASPAFFAGVMDRVGGQRQATAAGLFSGLFDWAFASRLAFASLLMLAVLGGYLVSRESDFTGNMSPEALLAQQETPAFTSGQAQDNMLVTLTAYDRH